MRNITGQVAEGNDFFDRKEEMARYWRNLETDNLLLLAPRRVGKTSLMKKMMENAGASSFTTVFADVCDCRDELHLVQRLYASILETDSGERLWNQIKASWLGKFTDRVQKVGGAGFALEFRHNDVAWTRLGDELADALARIEGRWLIQIDELPVFVLKLLNQDGTSDRARVREFLYWLRRLRQQHTGVRWMLAGSIGLDTIAARLNIADAINDLRIEKLGPFETSTADALLRALAKSYSVNLSEAVRGHIIQRVGWLVPFYLQLIFHELRDVSDVVKNADVDTIIEDLFAPQHKNYFDYWRQRLHDELGSTDADCALILLHQCCRSSPGPARAALSMVLSGRVSNPAAREDKLRYLLDILQNDGYLVEQDGRWNFRSPLLREYWLRRLAPQEVSQ